MPEVVAAYLWQVAPVGSSLKDSFARFSELVGVPVFVAKVRPGRVRGLDLGGEGRDISSIKQADYLAP